ncbi:hypothetical protein Tco_0554053 [Tanacetum coccineum]
MCQTPRQIKRGRDIKIPSLVVPLKKVGDEAVHKDLYDRIERAATTASSLEAEQDSDAQTRFKTTSKQSNDPPLSKVNTYGSGKDSMQLIELMTPCTKLSALLQLTAAKLKHQLVVSVQVPVAEEKPAESEGFEQIVDFLNANPIRYALTINPTIYISCIQQFWDSVKLKTINGDIQIQALIDGKKIIVNEASIRRDLKLDDAEGSPCLPNATIFEELTRMGAKTIAWNEFSSTMTSAIICLANNQKFNFLKYIFDSMVLDLEKAKSDQAIKIASLKKRVNKLENRRKFRTTWLKRLKKVGASRRIESSDDSLGAQEDASKQGRRIKDIDADAKFWMVMRCLYVTTVEKEEQSTKTGEAVTTAGVEDCAAPTIPTTVEDSAASTIPTTEEQVTMSTVFVTQPSIKGKGKGIMQEPERSLKRKDQVDLDEQMARDIQAHLDAKIIEEERLERQKQEEANIALIESWENT